VASASASIALDQLSFADRFTPLPHVAWTRYTDATVLLDADRGLYYTLNDAAGRTWELLAAGEPVLEILRLLGDEYEIDSATLQADVARLLHQLLSARLIRRAAAP
jgi:hypothetical protein